MTTEPTTNVLAGSVPTDQPDAAAVGAPASPQPGKVKKKTINAKRARERLVQLSMGLVTAACAATLYALLGFSMASAVLAGGLIWAGLMTVHVQIKKNAEIAHLKAELARMQAAGGAVAAGDAAQTQSIEAVTPAPAATPVPRTRAAPRRPAGVIAPAHGSETGSNVQPTTSKEPSAGPQPHPRWEVPAGQARAPQRSADTGAGVRSPAVETALWPGTSLSSADPMRDQWAFRPKDSTVETPQPLASQDYVGQDRPAPVAAPSNIDADLEMVQRKIKALADEVNAAEQIRDRQPNVAQASAIEKSIGALKATAETMRERPQPTLHHPEPQSRVVARERRSEAPAPVQAAVAPSQAAQNQTLPFDLMIPATAERIAVSDPGQTARQPFMQQPVVQHAEAAAAPHQMPQQPILELPELPVFEFASLPEPSSEPLPNPRPNPRLAAIIAAVESGAMDVFLSPIVALQSHQVSHYDVTVRVKNPAGTYLDDAEQELQLAGSDVLALFDTARLKRAAGLAQRLDAHNKSGSLLSAVNGPSITNAEFLETFARVYEERDRISNQLVLTFSQADLEQFSPSAWQALSDMHAFGFRFALSKIDHVAMDFAALAERGFAFLRLEASALTNGLPARDRFIGADELCKHLAGAGMTLVADTIDDEAVRARVFGFGVLFGQGRLFGGARHVKLDSLPAGSSAAA